MTDTHDFALKLWQDYKTKRITYKEFQDKIWQLENESIESEKDTVESGVEDEGMF